MNVLSVPLIYAYLCSFNHLDAGKVCVLLCFIEQCLVLLKVVNPVDGNSLVLASSYSLWSSTWTQQPLANDVTSNTPQQSKVIQSICCNVCYIDCIFKDVYKKKQFAKETYLEFANAV